MPKTNLKLGSLGYAAVGSGPSTSMGSITGNAANTSLSDFAFDSVTVTHPFTYIVEGTTEQLKFVFAQSGSRFNTYNKGRGANYVVTTDNEVFFSTSATLPCRDDSILGAEYDKLFSICPAKPFKKVVVKIELMSVNISISETSPAS